MGLKRRIYSTQTLTVDGTELPVKNFSVSREIPKEPVMGIGILKGGDQIQKGVETFKVDVKCFLPKAGGGVAAIPTSFFPTLCKKAEKGVYSSIAITDASASALNVVLTSISMDNTVGDFVELGLGFQGIGDPQLNDIGTDITIAPGVSTTKDMAVYDSSEVTLHSDYGDTIKSVKFSFELNVEPLFHLGVPSSMLNSAAVTHLAKAACIAKAPYKASLSFDGTQVKARADANNRGGDLPAVSFGNQSFTIANGALKSFSVSQTPGEIGAAFSASYEGTYIASLFS
jgi:hypothetical protein